MSPPPQRPITFEDLQRVRGKVEQERRNPNRYDENRARRYIFNEALNEGDLDQALYDNQQWSDDYFPEGSEELRSNADISDFPNAIRFRGSDIDPDLDGFELANIAASQPNQALDFLNSRIVSPETTQSIYEGFSRAPADEINLIRTVLDRGATTSDIYEGFEGEERRQILDEINRAGRGQPNAPSIADLYAPVNQISRELKEKFDFVQQQQRDFKTRSRDVARSAASLNIPFSPGTEQQRLNFVDEIDPREKLVAEAARIIDRPPASFEDYAASNNRLVTLARDLNAIVRNNNSRNREQRYNQILPAVRESPRGDEIINAVRGAAEENQRPTLFDTGIPTPATPDDAERMRISLSFSPAEMRNELDALEERARRTGQLVIPELRNKVMESIDKEAINQLEGALRQYPEVIPLLSNAPKTIAPVGGKEEFSKYANFIDSVQQVSDPKDRADIYNSLMTERGTPQYELAGIEYDYTSGSTERQQRALERLSQLNPEAIEKLSRVSSQAASTVRPLIGGGKYVGRDDPEAREMINKIDERARVFRKAFNDLSPELRNKLFNKYTQSVDNPTELYVRYNPDTDEVIPAKIDDIGEIYGLSMTNSPPKTPSIADSRRFQAQGDISENALKFLVKNPILGTSTISFQTLSPEENRFTYDAKELPPPVSKAFTEFISKNALAGMPPGTLVVNKPLQEFDLEEVAETKGNASSTFRKQQEVIGTPANKRGLSYQRGGFGPMQGQEQSQFAYINKEGKVIPLQLYPAETPIRGELSFSGNQAKVIQSSLPSVKTYYSLDPISATALGALQKGQDLTEWWNLGRNTRIPNESNASWRELLRDDRSQLTRTDAAFEAGETGLKGIRPLKAFTPNMIRTGPTPAVRQAFERPIRSIVRNPGSLLPGLSDLIPSPEAIQTGYKQGPVAMGKQMGREFVQSLPTGAAFAGALSTPALAPFAPGVGLGFVGSAAVNAANEVIRQETGEGIVPKARQFIGTAPRTNVAGKPRMAEAPLTAEIKPLSAQGKAEMNRRQNRNELQKRMELAGERFNPRRGEFGLSEILFGR